MMSNSRYAFHPTGKNHPQFPKFRSGMTVRRGSIARREKSDSCIRDELAAGSDRMIGMFRRPSGYPSKAVLDPRAYMLSLLKRRELRGQWQRACELLSLRPMLPS